jgi:hypothetical protein
MAALCSRGVVPDRWNENGDDELHHDSIPRVPTRTSGVRFKSGRDDDQQASEDTRHESRPEAWPVRGVDMPVVPMQWIDHDSQPQPMTSMVSLEPLAPLWLEDQLLPEQHRQPQVFETSSIEPPSKCARSVMPTIPSLWMSDLTVVAPGDQCVDLDEECAPPVFQVIPFEPLVSTMAKSKALLVNVTLTERSKDWKRSPPCRSNCRKLVPVNELLSLDDRACEMPKVPFPWINQPPGSTIPSLSNEAKGLSDCAEDELSLSGTPGRFRTVPFEESVTAQCFVLPPIRPPSTLPVSTSIPARIQVSRSLDEFEWRRNLRSTSILWSREVASGVDTSGAEDWTMSSVEWLEQVAKVRGTKGRLLQYERSASSRPPHEEESAPRMRPSPIRRRGIDAAPSDQLDVINRGSDPIAPASKPKAVDNLIHSKPMLCLYQDMPTSQKDSRERKNLPNLGFAWLPASVSDKANDTSL